MAVMTHLSWFSHTMEQDNSSIMVTVAQFYTLRQILYDRLITCWLPSTSLKLQVFTLSLGAQTTKLRIKTLLNSSLHMKELNNTECHNVKNYCLLLLKIGRQNLFFPLVQDILGTRICHGNRCTCKSKNRKKILRETLAE